MGKVGVVYVHINKINGKAYVGQTLQDPERRFRKNSKTYVNYKSCSVFYKALKKYGWDNFETTLLASANSILNLNYLEEYFINLYNSMVPNGYNSVLQTPERVVYSQSVKDKLSCANIGKVHRPAWNRKMPFIVNGTLPKE